MKRRLVSISLTLAIMITLLSATGIVFVDASNSTADLFGLWEYVSGSGLSGSGSIEFFTNGELIVGNGGGGTWSASGNNLTITYRTGRYSSPLRYQTSTLDFTYQITGSGTSETLTLTHHYEGDGVYRKVVSQSQPQDINALIGKWNRVDGSALNAVIEFNSNGTISVGSGPGTWTADNTRILFFYRDGWQGGVESTTYIAYNFSITDSGTVLYLVHDHPEYGESRFLLEGAVLPPDQPPQTPTSEYIYDTVDPGMSINFPTHLIDTITDRASAVAAVNAAVSVMTNEQKQSATGIDHLTLFAEEAVAQAASMTVSGNNVVIDQATLLPLQSVAADVSAAAEQALMSSGITLQRDIRVEVKYITTSSTTINITIEPSAASTVTGYVCVETLNYSITIPDNLIRTEASAQALHITVSESAASTSANSRALSTEGRILSLLAYSNARTERYSQPGEGRVYTITFDREPDENVRVSLPRLAGSTTYQAVTDTGGDAVGGSYNPITDRIEARINSSGTYTVRENRVDFSDISGKSQEMQEAISILASRGIINGTTPTTFSPDASITRAEIAALIVRTLSRLDPNADGGFRDVLRSDWFFGAVGSARRFGIVNGVTDTEFEPLSTILKEQIIAICARTLRSEMGYRSPSNVSGTLSVYTDSGAIASWGLEDIALATRENLVVYRTDGAFNGSTAMTRGDAAIILYRLFLKIW